MPLVKRIPVALETDCRALANRVCSDAVCRLGIHHCRQPSTTTTSRLGAEPHCQAVCPSLIHRCARIRSQSLGPSSLGRSRRMYPQTGAMRALAPHARVLPLGCVQTLTGDTVVRGATRANMYRFLSQVSGRLWESSWVAGGIDWWLIVLLACGFPKR